MIEIKLRNIIETTEVLSKLAQKEMKAKLAYNVGKMLKQIENEMTIFSSTRAEMIKKYGEKDENGELKVFEDGNYKIDPKFIGTFNGEFSELLDTMITLNANKIYIDDIEGLDFTPQEMVLLEPFIEFEE